MDYPYGVQRKWMVFFGGTCTPFRPGGIAAYGFTVWNDLGTQFMFHGNGLAAVGPEADIWEAEYMGLLKGLAEVDRMSQNGDRIEIRTDNRLVIAHLRGESTISLRFKPLYDRALAAIRDFKATDRPVDLSLENTKNHSEVRLAKKAIKEAGQADPEITKKVTVPFGQFKGSSLWEVPEGYYQWLWSVEESEVLIPYRPA